MTDDPDKATAAQTAVAPSSRTVVRVCDRDEIARRVIETTQVMADGYRGGITGFSTVEDRDKAEAAATAVSNAGVFILKEFGFTMDEIKERVVAFRGS